MSQSLSIAEAALAKARLQTEIARQRLDADRHVRRLAAESRRLTSWRTYVERFPAAALATALGVGMLAGGGWKAANWRRRLARWLIATGAAKAQTVTFNDLAALWQAFRGTNKNEPFTDD